MKKLYGLVSLFVCALASGAQEPQTANVTGRLHSSDPAATAQRLAESCHTEQAAGELEQALRISPCYAAAHSNLGAQYLRLARYEEAGIEIQQALEIVGPNAVDPGNLAFAYAGLQRLDDAIAEAMPAARRELDKWKR